MNKEYTGRFVPFKPETQEMFSGDVLKAAEPPKIPCNDCENMVEWESYIRLLNFMLAKPNQRPGSEERTKLWIKSIITCRSCYAKKKVPSKLICVKCLKKEATVKKKFCVDCSSAEG